MVECVSLLYRRRKRIYPQISKHMNPITTMYTKVDYYALIPPMAQVRDQHGCATTVCFISATAVLPLATAFAVANVTIAIGTRAGTAGLLVLCSGPVSHARVGLRNNAIRTLQRLGAPE